MIAQADSYTVDQLGAWPWPGSLPRTLSGRAGTIIPIFQMEKKLRIRVWEWELSGYTFFTSLLPWVMQEPRHPM